MLLVSDKGFQTLIASATILLLVFIWINAVHATPVQPDYLQISAPAGDMHNVPAKRHSGNKIIPASGKKDHRQAHVKQHRYKKNHVSHNKGKKNRRLIAGKAARCRHHQDRTKLIAGKYHIHRSHRPAQASSVRQHLKIHTGSLDGFNPPSPDQKDAFERHLLLEDPLDGHTSSIVESAYNCVGIPYQWGGTTTEGFDCSGFIRYVFSENGIQISRSSREQAQEGKSVPLSELRPGDLVFFKFHNSHHKGKNRGRVNHVGLYIGQGLFIHASSSTEAHEIKVDKLVSAVYFPKIVEARRVLDSL